MSMRVGFVGMKGNFNRGIGQGVQKYIYEIWSNVDGQLKKEGGGADKIEIGFGSDYFLRRVSFTLLAKLRSYSGFDVLHMPAPILSNPRAPRKTKLVTTAHEFALLKESCPLYVKPTKLSFARPRSFFDAYTAKRIRNQVFTSDLILPNSTQTMEEAVSLGCDKGKMRVVPHAMDQKFIDTPITGKLNHKFTVGYVGRIGSRKNVKFAIDAVKKMDDQNMKFEIWGTVVPDYAEAVKIPTNEARIALMGFAPEEKIVSIMDNFDVFVFPSYYEGFGVEIIEAKSRGLPVILYKEAQIPEEIRRNCFEAEDEQQMAQIIKQLKENGYKEDMRKKAMEDARKFTWERTARETIAAYKEITKQ